MTDASDAGDEEGSDAIHEKRGHLITNGDNAVLGNPCEASTCDTQTSSGWAEAGVAWGDASWEATSYEFTVSEQEMRSSTEEDVTMSLNQSLENIIISSPDKEQSPP